MKLQKWLFFMVVSTVSLIAVTEGVVIFNLSKVNSQLFEVIQTKTRPPGLNSEFASDSLQRLRREALSRAALYEQIIEKNMLVDGMVVNRDSKGLPEGICDSLMFSSIRYYSLVKLGFNRAAHEAWEAILASRDGSQWRRHPRCGKSLSRDMIVGVLIALSADPPGGDDVFRSMLADIDQNNGFVGSGPFYVSWLSPGVSGLLRMEAERRHVPFGEWPWILKHSFSSIEYDALFIGEGYVSHLASLGLWLEVHQIERQKNANPRSLLGTISRIVGINAKLNTDIDIQRRQWITSQLRTINGSNLFFEWLYHKANDSLTIEREAILLSQLLSMRQFPQARLPRDCDRDADYLWQRREGESLPLVALCGSTWSGVDFLWMSALLGVGESDSLNHERNEVSKIRLSH